MEANPYLATAIRDCVQCPQMASLRLSDHGYAVPAEVGVEAPQRPLAVMCEAPGAQEAATGRPLVGPAGRIFNNLLKSAGIKREEIVILNRVRCRPPENRLANVPEAIGNCDQWTKAELTQYDPLVVVLMGGTALTAVFGATAKVGATRGSSRATASQYGWGARVFCATYHPASLLPNRSPQNFGLVVEDLMQAKELWTVLHEGLS